MKKGRKQNTEMIINDEAECIEFGGNGWPVSRRHGVCRREGLEGRGADGCKEVDLDLKGEH